jgi:hypothetical protein
MQTLTFARALDEAIARLRLREMFELLQKVFSAPGNYTLEEADKAAFADLAFALRAEYDRLGGESNEIVQLLGLDNLMSSKSMGALIAAFQSAPSYGPIVQDSRFRTLYHGLWSTLRLQATIKKLLVAPKLEGVPEGGKLIALVVTDYDGHGVSLVRLSTVLKELSGLYDVLSQALGTENGSPRVQYLDSGSNITIGLEGVSDVVDSLANLFAQAWRALRFREMDSFDRKISSANTGLDFIAGLKARVESGSLDAETASKLEHVAKRHMDHLLGAGVMTEEIEQVTQNDPGTVLLALRDTKLLGPGEGSEEAES